MDIAGNIAFKAISPTLGNINISSQVKTDGAVSLAASGLGKDGNGTITFNGVFTKK